jgi:hypothetical protein
MTTRADAVTTEAHSAVVAGGPSATSPEGPLVYLRMRRGWWVVLCVLLLAAVDAIPDVGPYLALAVLMWMVSGLAHARPRVPAAARSRRTARSRRGAERGASRSDPSGALTS